MMRYTIRITKVAVVRRLSVGRKRGRPAAWRGAATKNAPGEHSIPPSGRMNPALPAWVKRRRSHSQTDAAGCDINGEALRAVSRQMKGRRRFAVAPGSGNGPPPQECHAGQSDQRQ